MKKWQISNWSLKIFCIKKESKKNLQKYVRQTFDRKNGTEKLMLKKLLSNWCLTVNIRCTKKMSKNPFENYCERSFATEKKGREKWILEKIQDMLSNNQNWWVLTSKTRFWWHSNLIWFWFNFGPDFRAVDSFLKSGRGAWTFLAPLLPLHSN